jgi:hypothetical protein
METIKIKYDPKWKELAEIGLDIGQQDGHSIFSIITSKQLIDIYNKAGKLLAQKYRGSKRDDGGEPE